MPESKLKKQSLLELLSELPTLIRDLIQAEIASFKAELTARGKSVGVAVALFVVALFFLFWMFAVLIEAAIFAFALIVPAWLAALIVAGILLVIIVVLVLIGIASYKRATKAPEATIKEHIQTDVDVVKGVGPYDNH
ncbi:MULTISPECIES: phage holin family protein [unclassified Leifsonia]|uniref:phage holin family protein n=1 Tax=unclassified Leifsonia TaxID=2663824 RepID=UPI0006F2B3A3|nr:MULTISPECIES: phage holin family protein [unclassified Leifsonia]KQX05222.1 hypothetical protein ASC59_13600 [Leifsonia sp. Root1293]KRA08855.1 hypothetical protein ASD61_13600 [Leifsonia sp. Root60]